MWTPTRIAGDDFWPSFESVPFKGPTLTVKKQGDGMLRWALENHPSVSGYVESLQLKQSRNRKEAAMLGRMIDFNPAELGVKKARRLGSTEAATRRLVAITYGEKHSSWDTASHIEDGNFSLLTNKQERQMLSAAKFAKQVEASDGRPTGKPAAKSKAGAED
jgi:hypothetical protein